MSYFNSFPDVLYQFGNEDQLTSFNNISLYVDIIDQIKDRSSFYNFYTIVDGDRPDNVSQRLYNSPDLYWTFFLMNDNIREQGWPLTNFELTTKVQTDFPNITLTTREDISSRFKIGQTVTGLTSGATGTIIDKRIDFGQLIVDTDDTFLQSEIISSTNAQSVLETAVIVGSVVQYNSLHHYQDADGNWVDVDPFVGEAGVFNPITYTEFYTAQNDLLKEIRVIKPETISKVNRSFKKSLKI